MLQNRKTTNGTQTKRPHHAQLSIPYETKRWLTMKFKLLILIKADYWNLIRPIITCCLNQECQIMGQDLYSWGINLQPTLVQNNLLRQHSVTNCPEFNLIRIVGRIFLSSTQNWILYFWNSSWFWVREGEREKERENIDIAKMACNSVVNK